MSVGTAAVLVRRRGELMHEAGERRPGAMAALLGELREPVERVCERATTEAGEVVPANYNSAEQTVVSGEVAGVERAMELAKDAGAKRAVRLNVSGAFHSPLMAPSAPGLRDALGRAGLRDPAFPVFSNVTEEPCRRPSAAPAHVSGALVGPRSQPVGRLSRCAVRRDGSGQRSDRPDEAHRSGRAHRDMRNGGGHR
jgi:[acyl-carrier-protein] S-malonyltransferase